MFRRESKKRHRRGTAEGMAVPAQSALASGGETGRLRFGLRLAAALRAAGPMLLFGLRLWAAVCLAIYVAFWLQLDNPFWAGTSAAVVCQPQLGASLRKGWFRVGSTA